MNDVFKQLKGIMSPVTKSLDITTDKPGHYDVYTTHLMENGKPQWFGGIRLQKNYVSYYLMPVYCNPELLHDMSADLKKRMQGKSCFNFKTVDPRLFKELAALTRRAYEDYVSKGIISADQ